MGKKINKPIFLSEDERLAVQEAIEYVTDNSIFYDNNEDRYLDILNHAFSADMIIKLRRILKEMYERDIIL